MSYQVLARKWRPRIFSEMVGQEHVLQALINALDNDRLHHAYLFTGTRGVGKTTVARILAKCLNCEQGVSSTPCGECGSCLEIAEGRSVDLIEVDAASRTKVEDTRELLENVQYAPTRNRYKVYLIDEVHMLSTSSFNALLKTLEEPPPHVKFLLATTDPQKLPATVLSRCLQFNLKNMSPELIVGHLANVLQQETIVFEEPSLWLLARSADGSMRDALSLTDQAIAFGSGALSESDVRSMLGTVDLSFVYRLLQAVAAQDAAQALAVVADLSEHAPDYEGSLQEVISLLHRVAVAQVVPDAVDNSWGDARQVAELAASMTAEDVQLYYQIAINGKRDIGLASDLRSGLEMALLRMIAFRPAAVIDESIGPGDLEDAAAEAAPAVKKPEGPRESGLVPEVRPVPQTQPEQPPEPGSLPPSELLPSELLPTTEWPPVPDFQPNLESQPAGASGSQSDKLRDLFQPEFWAEFLEHLQLSGLVSNLVSNSELRKVDGNRAWLVLDEANSSLYNKDQAQRIGQILGQALGYEVDVDIQVGVCQRETPAARAVRLLAERQAQAVSAIESDPGVQLLVERFEGTLDRESIAPVKH
jgi:DNA polymerase-3 subunit gamma/tau